MKTLRNALFVLSVSFVSTGLPAHDFVDGHYCVKPYYAIDYRDEEKVRKLEVELEEYSNCLREFLMRENEQAYSHIRVAGDASDDLKAIAEDVASHVPNDLLEKWYEAASNEGVEP